MRKGIYRTLDGNAAYVSGPYAHTAFDMDMGERIPISEVDSRKYIRASDEGDRDIIYRQERGVNHWRLA